MTIPEKASFARKASYVYASSTIEQRNQSLILMKKALVENKEAIFSANQKDITSAKEFALDLPLMKRLSFDEKKLEDVLASIDALIALDDPLNLTILSKEIAKDLNLYKVTCPLGVLCVIFESRPDALVQIASLAIKSGNAILLKGGKEARNTNRALYNSISSALTQSSMPKDGVVLLETRDEIAQILKLNKEIDLIIPRGSNAFVQYIMQNTTIPVMGHADGICHTYIDEYANPTSAIDVAVDAKTQSYAVCNAMETLLIHQKIAPTLLPLIANALKDKDVEIRGDEKVCNFIHCKKADNADWATEYLDAILSIKIVSSLQEAIEHINYYGSHHTDCIVTEDTKNASCFTSSVDSAGVYVNCSTRFADGFRYGFGAEVGISTSKLHARGPVGLEGLCTYKYILLGKGHTVAQTIDGKIQYTHKTIQENCPL